MPAPGAERAQIAAELAKPGLTQVQRDAARQTGTWGRVEEAGRKVRVSDRTWQRRGHERPLGGCQEPSRKR